jgi:hypothetical protein
MPWNGPIEGAILTTRMGSGVIRSGRWKQSLLLGPIPEHNMRPPHRIKLPELDTKTRLRAT